LRQKKGSLESLLAKEVKDRYLFTPLFFNVLSQSAAGAGTFILVDIEGYKLEYTKKCGATYAINLNPTSQIEIGMWKGI